MKGLHFFRVKASEMMFVERGVCQLVLRLLEAVPALCELATSDCLEPQHLEDLLQVCFADDPNSNFSAPAEPDVCIRDSKFLKEAFLKFNSHIYDLNPYRNNYLKVVDLCVSIASCFSGEVNQRIVCTMLPYFLFQHLGCDIPLMKDPMCFVRGDQAECFDMLRDKVSGIELLESPGAGDGSSVSDIALLDELRQLEKDVAFETEWMRDDPELSLKLACVY